MANRMDVQEREARWKQLDGERDDGTYGTNTSKMDDILKMKEERLESMLMEGIAMQAETMNLKRQRHSYG